MSAKDHWAKIGFQSRLELFKQAYTLKSDNASFRLALLGAYLESFAYCDHEWPSGILGVNTIDDFDELVDEVLFAEELDVESAHSVRLAEFKSRVMMYKTRCFG
jgi:hypothetical protein